MSDTSAVQLTALVRQVLPIPSEGVSWQVEVIARPDEAGVDVERDVAIVRIQEGWREAIYDNGLSHVTRHYPLALTPVVPADLPEPLWGKPVGLWHGLTLELDYKNGLFTGTLNVVPAYISRTHDRLGLYAHRDPVVAGKNACCARRSKLRTLAARQKSVANLRSHLQAMARERLRRCTYESAFTTSLDPFRDLLPSRTIRVLEEYGRETVPLRELERVSLAVIPEVPDHLLCTLIYKLESAVSVAEREPSLYRRHFTDDENSAIEALARG